MGRKPKQKVPRGTGKKTEVTIGIKCKHCGSENSTKLTSRQANGSCVRVTYHNCKNCGKNFTSVTEVF